MSNTLLEFKGLVTEFQTEGNSVKAVKGISFTLNRGEAIGIVGVSGSGKSVTALSSMRLIPSPPGKITNGEIIYHSETGKKIDFLKISEEEMRSYRGNEISMIFQEPMTSLNPVFSCGNQVVEAIRLHQKINKKEAKKLTIDLFKEVQLPEPERIFNSYPHQISGGQKQRVMIAMAMSCQPSILIADEPTTALDVTVQKTILELMISLQKERNMGILFITHDLGVIAELADKVVVMYKGDIVEQGSVWDIFTNPQHPYTIKLLNSIPLSKEKFNSDANILLDAEKVNVNYPILKNVFGQVKEYLNAVKTVDIKIYSGSTTGLVGESGSGKSSLARALLGIEKAQGSIYFDGKDINLLSSSEKRNFKKDFQIVFQDPFGSLSPRMTIGEIIGEGLKVHDPNLRKSERIQRIQKALSDVELESSFMARFPHELSGGQRQRVAIARAIILEPKLILLDEPTSALDVSIQMQVLELLKDLQSRLGLAYLCISHDLKVIRYLSDYVYVMKDGSIVENGLSKNLFESPKHPYTQELLAASLV